MDKLVLDLAPAVEVFLFKNDELKHKDLRLIDLLIEDLIPTVEDFLFKNDQS